MIPRYAVSTTAILQDHKSLSDEVCFGRWMRCMYAIVLLQSFVFCIRISFVHKHLYYRFYCIQCAVIGAKSHGKPNNVFERGTFCNMWLCGCVAQQNAIGINDMTNISHEFVCVCVSWVWKRKFPFWLVLCVYFTH